MAKPAPLSPTLPQHADRFLATLKSERSRSVSRTETNYRNALKNFQTFAEHSRLTAKSTPLPPHAWRKETLADYATWQRERRYRNATVRLYLTVAEQYLRWLAGKELLPPGLSVEVIKSHLEDVVGRRSKRLRPARRGSEPAIGVLLEYFAEQLKGLQDPEKHTQKRLTLLRNHALLQTLYATAGRISEVLALRRADVAGGRAAWVRIEGKGGKERTLVLTPAAQTAIRQYVNARQDTADALFISHGRGKGEPLTPKSAWRIINEAARATLGKRMRGGPHSFRHLRAQDLADEGMDIATLQEMLGHASIATTRSIYAPKTPRSKLLDEVATYGLDPKEVVKRGKRALE